MDDWEELGERSSGHFKATLDELTNMEDQMSPWKQIQQMQPVQWYIFLAGVILFISAKTVAHRALTFYISSAVSGVLLSFLFLFVFIRRFLPKRLFYIPLDFLGWPAISYLYYYGYSHAQEIAMQNWKWIALYVIVAATISLVICYVSDVSGNVRIRNVLQWLLQLVGVIVMFYSSQNIVLSMITILTVLVFDRGFHRYIWRFIKWLNKKPETRKLLTRKEYENEGAEFTKRELEKLRLSMLDDCRYNSPNRSFSSRCANQDQLASFLMTSQDVSLQSQLDYQREYSKANYTDDDEEELMEVDSGTEEYLLTDDDF